jgi:hypothetical protein
VELFGPFHLHDSYWRKDHQNRKVKPCFLGAAEAEASDTPVQAPGGLGDWKLWVEIFRISPAIFALMGVIYLLYRLILSKDATLSAMVRASEQDIERQAKILTLLETLVQSRLGNGGGGK